MSTVKPFGTWDSPLTPTLVASASVKLREVRFDDETLYWIEGRPTENGREVLMKSTLGKTEEVLAPTFTVRARVHEYGGGAFNAQMGRLAFVNDKTQKIHLDGNALETPDEFRYTDFVIAPTTVIAVEEEFRKKEPTSRIVALSNGKRSVLREGKDFHASPVLSPDGKRLAWLEWSHPNMPWDGTELWTADFDGQTLSQAKRVAGGETESVFQPQWSPQGRLYYVSDRTGWWNLYEGDTAVYPLEAEFGLPQWVFGMSTYGFFPDGEIFCARMEKGRWKLAIGKTTFLDIGVEGAEISYVRVGKTKAAFILSQVNAFPSVCTWDRETKKLEVVRSSGNPAIEKTYFSAAQTFSFSTSRGDVFAHFYAPKNPEYRGESDTRPPLVVSCHGGPTGNTTSSLNLGVQYWTTRGFAFLDVNYGGSTGYGREYRERLKGQWGIVDCDDTVAGIRDVVAKGWADDKAVVIRGSSSGGFTALMAIVRHPVFRAGAVYFGVSDLEALAKDTHKFESHYDKGLLGGGLDVARARSPLRFVDEISTPLVLFQGLEDRIVPPSQTESMVAALKAHGVDVKYLAFEGEGHGFRQASTVETCLRIELEFYRRQFGW